MDDKKLGSFVKEVYESIKQKNANNGKYSEEEAFGRLFKVLYITVQQEKGNVKLSTPSILMMSKHKNSQDLIVENGAVLDQTLTSNHTARHPVMKGASALKNILKLVGSTPRTSPKDTTTVSGGNELKNVKQAGR